MAKCSSCSAPLPPLSHRCAYCGAQNDIDLQGIHRYTIEESGEKRICSRCMTALQTINISSPRQFLIERCATCMGLFFDPGEIEGLLDESVKNAFSIDLRRLSDLADSAPLHTMPERYIKCPVCSSLMNRVNFGARSGVIVDRCRDHGVWLDGGELRRLFEWRKAGGQLYHEKLLLERKKQEQEQQKRRKAEHELFISKQRNPEINFSGSRSGMEMDFTELISRFLGKIL